MEDLKASKKVKQNHLYCPLVAGCTVGLKTSPSMLSDRTWAQLKVYVKYILPLHLRSAVYVLSAVSSRKKTVAAQPSGLPHPSAEGQ